MPCYMLMHIITKQTSSHKAMDNKQRVVTLPWYLCNRCTPATYALLGDTMTGSVDMVCGSASVSLAADSSMGCKTGSFDSDTNGSGCGQRSELLAGALIASAGDALDSFVTDITICGGKAGSGGGSSVLACALCAFDTAGLKLHEVSRQANEFELP